MPARCITILIWAGRSHRTAWYDLPDINSSPTYDDYNSVYETIYNIYKLGDGEVFSGRVTDPCGNPISDVNVKQGVYPGPNPLIARLTNARGIYAFYGVNSDTNFAVWATKPGYVFPAPDDNPDGAFHRLKCYIGESMGR